jgi:Bacterial regulatory proteins, gntR family
MYPAAMTHAPSGHIEQLPSGSWRAKVYAGKDPLTGREIRFRKTRRTEVEAQIVLGKLLELARAGRQPDSGVTVVELLDEYVPIAGWDVSTTDTNLGYIRRTIKPALGTREVRKVRGPLLDNLYARLQKCGNLACAGQPFIEHRHVPDLRPNPSDGQMEWEQAAGRLREAIAYGALAPGDELPSVPELARLQGLKQGTLRHAFLVLADERTTGHPSRPDHQGRGGTARHKRPGRTVPISQIAPRPRLHAVWLPTARLQTDVREHHPHHPQHPVRGIRGRPALGVGRLQPSRIRQTAHRKAEEAASHPAARGREGDRAGPL